MIKKSKINVLMKILLYVEEVLAYTVQNC
jgi:hypothetical protein